MDSGWPTDLLLGTLGGTVSLNPHEATGGKLDSHHGTDKKNGTQKVGMARYSTGVINVEAWILIHIPIILALLFFKLYTEFLKFKVKADYYQIIVIITDYDNVAFYYQTLLFSRYHFLTQYKTYQIINLLCDSRVSYSMLHKRKRNGSFMVDWLINNKFSGEYKYKSPLVYLKTCPFLYHVIFQTTVH